MLSVYIQTENKVHFCFSENIPIIQGYTLRLQLYAVLLLKVKDYLNLPFFLTSRYLTTS